MTAARKREMDRAEKIIEGGGVPAWYDPREWREADAQDDKHAPISVLDLEGI